MSNKIELELDDDSARPARAAAARGKMTVDAHLSDLVKQFLPPMPHPDRAHVSSIFALVSEGEPTDIAGDKDKLIGEAVWQEYLEETKQK